MREPGLLEYAVVIILVAVVIGAVLAFVKPFDTWGAPIQRPYYQQPYYGGNDTTIIQDNRQIVYVSGTPIVVTATPAPATTMVVQKTYNISTTRTGDSSFTVTRVVPVPTTPAPVWTAKSSWPTVKPAPTARKK